jgi:hypothetical protein
LADQNFDGAASLFYDAQKSIETMKKKKPRVPSRVFAAYFHRIPSKIIYLK